MVQLANNNGRTHERAELIDDNDDDDDDDDGIMPKSKSLNFDLNVSLRELYMGKKKKIHVKRKIFKNGKTITEKKKLSIPIYPGMKDDEVIRFEGEGDHKEGNQPGDIIIRICEEPHEDFERRGDHLLLYKEISLSEAFSLRCSIQLLNGKTIYIETDEPIHINSGMRKIKGYGMPIYNDQSDTQEYGDLFIKFNLVTPMFINKKYAENLKEIFPPLNEVTSMDNPCKLDELTDHDYQHFYE